MPAHAQSIVERMQLYLLALVAQRRASAVIIRTGDLSAQAIG
jgi:hypothetical protein